MFCCPKNYGEFKTEEWRIGIEAKIEYLQYVLKTFPVLCDFFNLPVYFKDEELEKAYREMRLNTHPDRPYGDNEKFMKAFEVYNELKAIRRRITMNYPTMDYSTMAGP